MKTLTDTHIKSLKKKTARYEEYEGGGFGLRVATTGAKTFIYRYKMDGKTYKLTLGHYSDMPPAKARETNPEERGLTLADARIKFTKLRELRRKGINPKDFINQQSQKDNNTVGELVLKWYSGYAEKIRKQPLQIKQQIDADIIPLLGHMILDKIQTRDISKALDVIVSRGAPIHANRVLSTIKQAFNYGVSRGSLQHNVASNIRSRDIGGTEKPRERFLTMTEIKVLWLFLDSSKHQLSLHLKNAIKILLLTGLRTSELRLSQWSEFNFAESLWIIPAEHTKSGVSLKIHLSPQVKALLIEMNQSSYSIYVLPITTGDKCIDKDALPRAISRIQKRVGIPKWRAQDLRRTVATQLGETLRIDPVVIEKCLGHQMPKIMRTYNKNEMLHERKEALNAWGKHIESIVTNSNVVSLERVV